jgi:cytoskeletal protein RodZ
MQHSFGTYLREKRNEEQLTLRTVAKKLDITATVPQR